jgi:hypothetical protein
LNQKVGAATLEANVTLLSAKQSTAGLSIFPYEVIIDGRVSMLERHGIKAFQKGMTND